MSCAWSAAERFSMHVKSGRKPDSGFCLLVCAVTAIIAFFVVLCCLPTSPGFPLVRGGNRTLQLLDHQHSSALPSHTTSWPYYVTRPSDKCLESSHSAFIGILSGGLPKYRERRDAVRQTWATWAPQLNFTIKFFVDIPPATQDRKGLIDELSTYQDVVAMDPTFQQGPGNIWNRRAAWLVQ